MSEPIEPESYVKENREILVEVIKHGDDKFVRALCLAALVKYGGDPAVHQLKREVDRLDRMKEDLR
jgi:hypothetical protein